MMRKRIGDDICRGDIFWCTPRNSPNGKRMYVVVSNNLACKYSDTILMSPLTSKHKKDMPTHVKLENINGRDATILCENIVTINKEDIMDYVLTLNDYEMRKMNVAIYISVGL